MQSILMNDERISVLDQLRGFALFTIFLVNLDHFGSIYSTLSLGGNSAMDGSGQIDNWIHIIFGNSSRPLFAFMFGITMVIMYDRSKRRGKNPYFILLRRMIVLLLIGVLHYLFIWDGDILFMYALDGLLLLLFVSMSAWPLFLFGLLAIFLYQPPPVSVSLYIDGNYIELWNYNLMELPNFILFRPFSWLHPNFSIEFSRATQHLSFFLFGMAAYRSGLFKYKHGFWSLLTGLFLLSLGIWGKYQLSFNLDFKWLNLTMLWNFSVSVGIVFLFLFLSQKASPLIKPFTWIGRMTLTNYVLQSFVFVSLFIGAGTTPLNRIAWLHPIAFHYFLIVALIFFSLQMWLSKCWLSRFNYGPLEWLWKNASYWKIFSMRRHPEPDIDESEEAILKR